MKLKTLTGMAALMTLTATSAQAQEFIGKLTEMPCKKVMVFIQDSKLPRDQRQDTIDAPNGEFSYKTDKIKQATQVALYPVRDMTGNKVQAMSMTPFTLILMPGEKAELTGTWDKPVMGGSAFYTEMQKANEPLDAIDEKMRAVYTQFSPLMRNGGSDSLRQAFSDAMAPLYEERKQAQLSYIKANPDSEVSAVIAGQMAMKDIKEAVALLGQKAQNGRTAHLYKQTLKRIEEQELKERQSKEMEGKPAPDFSLPDLNGKNVALKDFRGKYVIVDFWGSWCGWCIKGIPDMKKYYEKYKDKMEILSVDCRDTEKKWREAVAKHNLTWTNVRCDENCDLPKVYNVLGYPTKCIVDPEGKLVKTIVGEDPAFYTLLDELLGK